MSLLRTSLGASFLNHHVGDTMWDPMIMSEDSLPSTEYEPPRPDAAKLRAALFVSGSERAAQHLHGLASTHIPKDSKLHAFAAIAIEGGDEFAPRLRGLLQSHYMLASALRGFVQILAMTVVQSLEHETAARLSTTVQLFEDLHCFLEDTLCVLGDLPDGTSMQVAVFLFYGWAVPLAVQFQVGPVMRACADLCCIVQSLSRERAAFPMPPRHYGWSASQFADACRTAALACFGPMPHAPSLESAPLYAAMTAPAIHENKPCCGSLASVVQTRTGLVLDKRLHRFLGSLQRAPLPFPPFETRAPDTGDSELEFDLAGKKAVRAACHGGNPEALPLDLLPPCAARVLWRTTPVAQGGGWKAGDGVWSNDDRYYMATFMQDIGEFPIEEMDRFFRDRLSLEGTASDCHRRTRHALHHTQGHHGKIEAKRQRGEPPYVTPTCRNMVNTTAMSDRRSFRCPFSADADESETRKVLSWQGMSKGDIDAVIATSQREGHEHACLAAYNQTTGGQTRSRPFTYPHHYTYFAALTEERRR